MTEGIFSQKDYRFITMARGSLVSLIFLKTLSVSANVAQDKGSSTLTLMSTDVDKICRGLDGLHDMWASPIEVGIALWLLERELGVPCIVPALLALGTLSVLFSKVTVY